MNFDSTANNNLNWNQTYSKQVTNTQKVGFMLDNDQLAQTVVMEKKMSQSGFPPRRTFTME